MASATYNEYISMDRDRTDDHTQTTAPDVTELKWKEGTRLPHKMRRAVHSIVGNNCVYIRPWGEVSIYQYDSVHKNWQKFPDCQYEYASLAIVCNLLTTIGGEKDGQCTDKLLSLTWRSTHRQWEECFPPMQTKRKNPITVTSGKHLVAVGGIQAGRYLTTVELLDTENKVWSTAANIPEPLFNASVTISNGSIYMLGGNSKPGQPTTTVLSCTMLNLTQSCEKEGTQVWKRLADLPVERSSCVSMYGHLLAIGGQRHRNHDLLLPTSAMHLMSTVYLYSPGLNTWSAVSDLGVPLSECFAAVLPDNKIMVLGGNAKQGVTDKVLIGSFN